MTDGNIIYNCHRLLSPNTGQSVKLWLCMLRQLSGVQTDSEAGREALSNGSSYALVGQSKKLQLCSYRAICHGFVNEL
jgi:hypothetical protein